jgi:hypothetical protein
MALPAETLEKLQSVNMESEDRYSVFMYWVNRDLIPPHGDPPLFGIVVPCGEYSKRKAERERDRLLAETGAHCVVWCANNQAFPIRPHPGPDTLVYNHDTGKSVGEITESIKKAKIRRAAVDSRAEKEVQERSDINSMSYLINKIYRATTSKEKADKLLEMATTCTKAHDENLELVIAHLLSHPEHIDTWESEARERFTERGEHALFEKISITMQLLKPIISQRLPDVK